MACKSGIERVYRSTFRPFTPKGITSPLFGEFAPSLTLTDAIFARPKSQNLSVTALGQKILAGLMSRRMCLPRAQRCNQSPAAQANLSAQFRHLEQGLTATNVPAF